MRGRAPGRLRTGAVSIAHAPDGRLGEFEGDADTRLVPVSSRFRPKRCQRSLSGWRSVQDEDQTARKPREMGVNQRERQGSLLRSDHIVTVYELG